MLFVVGVYEEGFWVSRGFRLITDTSYSSQIIKIILNTGIIPTI